MLVINKMMMLWAISLSLSLTATTVSAQEKPDRSRRIRVVKSDSTPVLDASERGFEKTLLRAGYKERVNIIYERHNVQGNTAKVGAMARAFLTSKVDLIHVIGMPASEVIVRTVKDIPIVFSAVKDPVAAGLVPRNSGPGMRTGTNVTGVSDHWPIFLQFETFTAIVPKAKKWGTVYNARDVETFNCLRELREVAKKLGVELTEATASNKAEAVYAVQSLARKVQAIHITADRTAISSFEAIAKVCNETKVPLFAGDLGTASRGGIAAYGVDYHLVGISAGRRAERILGGQKPGDIPWGLSDAFSLIVNEKAARAQGIAIPPVFLKRADKLIE